MAKKITLQISGMSCNHCIMTIQNKLAEGNTVKDVIVDLYKKEAYSKTKEDVDVTRLIKEIQDLGYGAMVK